MTRILAVETSGDYASAALLADGEVVCSIFKEKNRHTESLISLADEVLSRKNLKVADMDAVAFGAGPGAFTGLRVACGVAQGLSWAIGKPTVQVGNLAAAAYSVFQLHPDINRICVVNDARMHECYTASYERAAQGGMPLELRAPELVKPGDVKECLLADGIEAVIGTAFTAYEEEIEVPDKCDFSSNTNVAGIEESLTRRIGISENLNTPPEGHSRLPLAANIRHALYYCFQGQR